VDTRLEFGILGPLEVRLDGAAVRVGGPRQRALLAMFLFDANRVVSRDRLIDELLGDQPPESADRILRVQISRLRKALASSGDEPRLLAQPPGYLLRVEAGELDLHTFERLVAEGRQALEQDNPGRAAAMLREAESLWRGRPLADLEFEPFARLDVQRLDELRLLTAEERIDAELALGRHAALCPELEALAEQHPLRERLRGQLMLALYRAGRQADALDVYRAGRAVLVAELALEPTPQLRQLEQAILQQDAALEVREPTPHRVTPAGVAAPSDAVPSKALRADAPSSHERRRRPVRLAALVAAVGAALAALAVAIAPERGSSTPRPQTVTGNVLALIAPGDGEVKATIRLQAPPTDMAAGFGSLWVAEPDAGLIARVDSRRRAVVATIPVGRRPTRIVTAVGQVWVLDTFDRTLSRIDPDTDTVAQTVALGGSPSDVASGAGSLWVTNGEGTVSRIDPKTGRTESVVRTETGASALAAAGGTVWVANDESGTVDRIDARSGVVTDAIRVGDAPAAVAASTAEVWVLDRLDATLSRIDPRRDVVDATVALPGAPASLTLLNGSVWVADEQHGTLFRLDPQRAAITNTIRPGGRVRALAAAGGLWVASDAIGAGHRGGTLTSVASSAVIDTIDPAASTSVNLPPPRLFGLTNDGLVTLNHVAGPDGARLVPDLTVALPVPTDSGRTYTFHLRPGIRYSTGALVKPSDVTNSFERLFELGSSGASYYGAISGAPECSRARGGCDLARGIVADDHADTVTFRLDRPDPDFLYKLTLTYADVLPASTPGREARTPLPATGPYMIGSYVPGQELRLVRNLRFREWSAAAQPDGYPDQILIRLGLSGPQGTTAIADGEGDFLANIGTLPGNAAYFPGQHRSQVRINPSMTTSALALNVTAPPFNDLRVRRALNLALDRKRIVAAYGGPGAATATCQILPPHLPGYRRFCPYTSDPSPDGRWQSPDLAQARRLVAASGTKGMNITVWDTPAPQFTVNESKLTVTALKQLGYRATLRLLPDSTYFDYTNDSRNHAQVIDGGWSADYPSANDFIGKLTCNYFVPDNGAATTDASDFCAPAFDRQVARAASLQTTDPPAATALWARLDRRLTDLAIWLPTVTPNETDLVSSRVGDYQYNPVWGALIDQLWVR
jgi:ABC-type transport system substrate-binding protein/DNA-binding SARP family transcriptional activator